MQRMDQKPLIVLISADANVRDWIGNVCVSKKYDYLEFPGSTAFAAAAVKDEIDVAVFHAQCDGNWGYELAAKIKENDKNTRIVIMTERPSETCERKARSLGIVYFAIWPEDRDYLKDVFAAATISRHRERLWLNRKVDCFINQRACL